MFIDPQQTAPAQTAGVLQTRYAGATTTELLRAVITQEFPGRLAVISSFGADAAVLLHLVSRIDPATPVIFLDTGQLFAQTETYRRELTTWLGLTDVRIIPPDAQALADRDPHGDLWRHDPDACCALRKVEPLARALGGFDAWINGRKRFQGGARAGLPLIETAGGRVKINPLARWSAQWIEDYHAAHDLPRHPLHAFGFTSIGCHPCTAPVGDAAAPRGGRWTGTQKTECGIHTLR
ncbi:MAG: phosphoadenylyl-sulfate reductase [Alphaproteobacteria bacterium]